MPLPRSMAVPVSNTHPVLPALQAQDFHRNLGELQDELVLQHAYHMTAEQVGRQPACLPD